MQMEITIAAPRLLVQCVDFLKQIDRTFFTTEEKNAGQPYNDWIRNLVAQRPLPGYFSREVANSLQLVIVYQRIWMAQ